MLPISVMECSVCGQSSTELGNIFREACVGCSTLMSSNDRIIEASAPGKLILCGEHAVVYSQPAIAVPIASVRAYARIEPAPVGRGVTIRAMDLGKQWRVATEPNDPHGDATPEDPLCELTRATFQTVQRAMDDADLSITLTATIPIAAGMGSGAAIATALVRAISAWAGVPLPAQQVSSLVYRCEQRYHGTPSGIDNTVIAYEQPIWFVRRSGGDSGMLGNALPSPRIEPVTLRTPLTMLIGDTGERCETRLPVGEVRRRWQTDPQRFEALFAQVGAIVTQVRAALAAGDIPTLGHLLNANQQLLETMGVSSPGLERLIRAAREAGAVGAKLSGGGWGGIMLALIADPVHAPAVTEALRAAGAVRILTARVEPTT